MKCPACHKRKGGTHFLCVLASKAGKAASGHRKARTSAQARKAAKASHVARAANKAKAALK